MVETAELQAFASIVEANSVSRAALLLGEPRATISRRLARLEKRLGTRLIRRTTRSLAVTDSGDALYRHARIVLDAIGQVEMCVHTADGEIRGDLRVSAPPALTPGFRGMLLEFAAKHPGVRMHVTSASRHVDLLRDGFDVALRASSRLEPGLVARKLAHGRIIAVASPAYLRAHGTPTTKRELVAHRLLLGFARGEVPQTQWPWKSETVAVIGVFAANEMSVLLEAAARDLGIAMVPAMIAEPLIESGLLVQVLAGIVESATTLAIVYPERELVPPQVRAFVDHVVAWAPRAFADARQPK